ncbi:MAG: cell division transport system permease protein [Candidatus Peribacteria bacterium]|nr:cell division transport system permease protein [Candidatus Peribacteria bacterium]
MSSSTFLIFTRGLKRGLVTLRRERGWLTTLLSLTGILVLAQLFVFMAIAGQGLESLIRSRMDVRLEILEGATDVQIREFFSAAKGQPTIHDVQYITKEQAYEAERLRDPQLISFLETLKLTNPFPETFNVTLRSLNDYDAFVAFVQNPQWSKIIDPNFLSKSTDQEKSIRELLKVTQAARLLVLAFLALTAFVLLFILMELVRRRSLLRSEEILIERLFGAHDLSVLLPFATESAALLVAALLVSMGLLIGFLFLLPTVFPVLASEGVFSGLRAQVDPLLRTFLPAFLSLELIIAPVLAFVGAWFGMRPQLRSRQLVVARL